MNYILQYKFKGYENRHWFDITKEELAQALDESHVDYSHVDKNNKWELVKFIKLILKNPIKKSLVDKIAEQALK
jgi:hypothetical protein